jgi:hypothetical protein
MPCPVGDYRLKYAEFERGSVVDAWRRNEAGCGGSQEIADITIWSDVYIIPDRAPLPIGSAGGTGRWENLLPCPD